MSSLLLTGVGDAPLADDIGPPAGYPSLDFSNASNSMYLAWGF